MEVQQLGNKGAALVDLGNYTQAITYFDKALAIDPNDKYALNLKQLAQVTLHTTLPIQTITGNVTKFLEYENSTYGIKIQYPSTWIKEGSHNASSNEVVTFGSSPGTSPAKSF
ncbi:MAG: tetratricopeptide repeat protein [Candidatus Nitrosopolaris sp.]